MMNQQQAQSQFNRVASPLASDLLKALEDEHIREVCVLYQEQCMLRAELKRVILLMQQELIPREKELHGVLDKLHEAYMKATQNLHQTTSRFGEHGSSKTLQSDQMRRQLLDPMQADEREIVRIQQMLSQPLVTAPDLPQDVVQRIHQNAAPMLMSQSRGMSPMNSQARGMSMPLSGPMFNQQVL